MERDNQQPQLITEKDENVRKITSPNTTNQMLNNNNSGSGTFENHFLDETGESLIKQTVSLNLLVIYNSFVFKMSHNP
jgi:hypothetical protein